MNFLRVLSNSTSRVTQLSPKLCVNKVTKRFRKPSICYVCCKSPDKKPCFDLGKVSLERGDQSTAKEIKSFLYSQYWPREPSVVGLWMALDCPYLEVLSERFANQGDRFLAYEHMERTNERKLIGVAVATRVYPWMIEEIEEWAHSTDSTPERSRMYFTAHCLRSPDLFKKYNVDFIYDIQVLGTVAEVAGQGVGTMLLRSAIKQGKDLRYPLVQIVSLSEYATKCATRLGMKQDWSMNYADFVDSVGQPVFFPRRPHNTVKIYTQHFNLSQGGRLPCKKQYHDDESVHVPKGTYYP